MAAAKISLDDLATRLDRLEQMLDRFGPVTDPAPDDWGRLPGRFDRWWWNIPVPPRPGDPSPVDISRFSRVQLELAIHQIAAERIRLDALEDMINQQLKGTTRR
ncbi:MAG TPA: hypothetical protein VE487_20185 [Ilumatobacter sp.]|jgi:hypothetical protein|nr:hypothetical protein [Ilumatobacter sp.]